MMTTNVYLQILAISIHWQSKGGTTVPFGKRAILYPWSAPFRQILAEEARGEHLSRDMPADIDWDAKSLPESDGHPDGRKAAERELESGRAGSVKRSGKMLVAGRNSLSLRHLILIRIIVSANNTIRDELRLAVRDHLGNGVSMVELDYRPEQ
jgi:hypothetical protein